MVVSPYFGGKSHGSNGQNVSLKEPCISYHLPNRSALFKEPRSKGFNTKTCQTKAVEQKPSAREVFALSLNFPGMGNSSTSFGWIGIDASARLGARTTRLEVSETDFGCCRIVSTSLAVVFGPKPMFVGSWGIPLSTSLQDPIILTMAPLT